tara:strand:- start:204 stop:707 length:504 start_codon:yes stop_codon:yes gene_type:complete
MNVKLLIGCIAVFSTVTAYAEVGQGHLLSFLQSTSAGKVVVDSERSPSSLFTYVTTQAALDEKLAEAKRQKKPVMIEFFATWCPYCKKVDQNVLSDAAIQASMKDFTTIRVDISEQSFELAQMMETYRVYGVPMLVFFDKEGRPFNASDLNEGITKRRLQSTLDKLA